MPVPSLDLQKIQQLRELSAGEPGVLSGLIAVFLKNAQEVLQKMDRACANRDANSLSELAHGLKSSCGTIGASQMYEYSVSIEDTLRGGNSDFNNLARIILDLNHEFSKVAKLLEKIAKSG